MVCLKEALLVSQIKNTNSQRGTSYKMDNIHKGFALAAVAVFLFVGCQTIASNTSQISEPTSLVVSPSDKRAYDTIQLENGIDVVLVSDPWAEKSAAALSIQVGSINTPTQHQGLPHYLEHMLFLGSQHFPTPNAYQTFIRNNGGVANAYTHLDITNYMFKVNTSAYDEALARFSDSFKNPLLSEVYIEKERNAVHAEWMAQRKSDYLAILNLSRSMLGSHPANHFFYGNLETLVDTPNSQLQQATRAFFEKYYSANLMKVAMVSNQPLDKMRALAQKHFSGIKNKRVKKPEVSTKLDMRKVGSKQINYVPNKDTQELRLSFITENNREQFNLKPNYFIRYLLNSEMPGSPAAILRNKGWASLLYVDSPLDSSLNTYGNYAPFSIAIKLTDEGVKHRNEITGLVLNYLELIREKGVDEKYFKEIKTSLTNQFQFLERQDEFNYVSSLTQTMRHYPLYHAIDAGYRYDKFDADAIHAVLKQLTPERLGVWHISKNEDVDSELHFYDGKYKISDLTRQQFARWKKQAANFPIQLPKVNTLLPDNFELTSGTMPQIAKPSKQQDKDGIQIWYQPSRYFSEQPRGEILVYINTPIRATDAKQAVLLELWSDIYALKNTELAEEASIAGMELNLYTEAGLVLHLSGFTDKQDLLMEHALKGLPIALDEQDFRQAIDRYIRQVTSSTLGSALWQLEDTKNRLVVQNRWDHQTLIDTAKMITLKDLQGFIQHTLKNNSLRVLMLGNYDNNDIQVTANRLKVSLPERKTTRYAIAKRWKPQAGERLVLQRDTKLQDLAIQDIAILSETGADTLAQAKILSHHLHSHIYSALRTEEQLAYNLGAATTKIGDYVGILFVIQTPVKKPVDMLKRFDDFKSEYQVKLDALTQAEFDKIKASTLTALREKPKNLSDELGRLVSDWYEENWEFDTRDKLIAATEKVTLADIKAVYKEAFFNQQTPRVVIQLRGEKFKDSPFARVRGQTLVEDLAQFHSDMQVQ